MGFSTRHSPTRAVEPMANKNFPLLLMFFFFFFISGEATSHPTLLDRTQSTEVHPAGRTQTYLEYRGTASHSRSPAGPHLAIKVHPA
jgi:hypothetical protein